MLGHVDHSWISSYEEIKESKSNEDQQMFPTNTVSTEDHWKQFPPRIMLENGTNHALMIRFDIRRNSREEYLIKPLTVQQEILEFLKSLPTCLGLGVQNDVNDIDTRMD